MLCLAQVALTPLACASFSIPMICSSLNLLFISFCSFYLSRTTLFNCPAFGGQASGSAISDDAFRQNGLFALFAAILIAWNGSMRQLARPPSLMTGLFCRERGLALSGIREAGIIHPPS